MKKALALGTLVSFILMIVVVVTIIVVFHSTVQNVNETKINNCSKCVDKDLECNDDEIAMNGFGCPENQFCCVKKSI